MTLKCDTKGNSNDSGYNKHIVNLIKLYRELVVSPASNKTEIITLYFYKHI